MVTEASYLTATGTSLISRAKAPGFKGRGAGECTTTLGLAIGGAITGAALLESHSAAPLEKSKSGVLVLCLRYLGLFAAVWVL